MGLSAPGNGNQSTRRDHVGPSLSDTVRYSDRLVARPSPLRRAQFSLWFVGHATYHTGTVHPSACSQMNCGFELGVWEAPGWGI